MKISEEDRAKRILKEYINDIASDEEMAKLGNSHLSEEERREIMDELLDRARNFVKFTITGNMVSVEGNTYPIRENLKDYKFRWDSYQRRWYQDIGEIGIKSVFKLASELRAVVRILVVADYVLENLTDEQKKIYEKVLEIGEKYGKFDEHTGYVLSADAVKEVWESMIGKKDMELGV